MKTLKRFLALFVLAFGLFFSLPEETRALTVSPPVKELSGNPGETVGGVVRVYNETAADLVVTASLSAFTAKAGESGEPQIVEVSPEEGASLPNWIKLPPGPFTVKSLDWQNILFEIPIPANAEPGGHYAAIFFKPQNPGEASQAVSVDYRTGALVLLTVAGEIKEAGRIESFGPENNKRLFEHIPVTYQLRVRNDGNVHFRPGGAVAVKNMFGQKAAEIPVVKGNAGGNVLPQSIRRYDITWGETDNLPTGFLAKAKYQWRHFSIGKYTAEAIVALPLGKTEIQVTSVWIIPWQLLLVILVLVVLFLLLFRTYNRWIIRQARKNN